MGEKRSAYRILAGKAEGRRPLGDIDVGGIILIVGLREIGWGGMDLIRIAQDRGQ
jgi:hypothetical protein